MFSDKHLLTATVHHLQTDPVRDQLVNIVEHLAAKEPEVSLSSWRPKQELEEKKVSA